MAVKGCGFPREERLRKRRDFLRVYAEGEKIEGRYFFLYFLENSSPESRLGITVSRKTGIPVQRNRIKRRLREIFRRNKEWIQPPCDVVVNARRAAAGADYHSLRAEFLSLVQVWRETK